jgi:pimeloyl-ACP methyl ester carboxylesterase
LHAKQEGPTSLEVDRLFDEIDQKIERHWSQQHSEDTVTDITLNNGGTKLALSVYGPENDHPVLFLHGISLSRDSWEEVALSLRSRYQVWTLDFRGHGHSDRASSYTLADYQSDAETALRAIGRPTVVVGHSLGACVAGTLAQERNPNIRAILLEDPPWYLGEMGVWAQSVYPKIFANVRAQQALLQQEEAPLAKYREFVSNSPSPMGGIASDHFSPRQLLSFASSLHRQDNDCWNNLVGSGELLANIAADGKFQCPAKIIQADPRCGAALLDGHEIRLAKANPKAEIVRYDGCGHRCHAQLAFYERFLMDLDSFLERVT